MILGDTVCQLLLDWLFKWRARNQTTIKPTGFDVDCWSVLFVQRLMDSIRLLIVGGICIYMYTNTNFITLILRIQMKLTLFQYLLYLLEFYSYESRNDIIRGIIRMVLTRYWNSKDKIADSFFFLFLKKEMQKKFLCTELLLISNGDIGYYYNIKFLHYFHRNARPIIILFINKILSKRKIHIRSVRSNRFTRVVYNEVDSKQASISD